MWLSHVNMALLHLDGESHNTDAFACVIVVVYALFLVWMLT